MQFSRCRTWRWIRPRLGRSIATLLLALPASAEDGASPFLGDDTRTAQVSPHRSQQAAAPSPVAPKPEVEEWPPTMLEGLSLQSERASEAVFNLIEDVEVASIKAGRGVVNARLGRRVFDNHDVLGSWTVVDHLRLDANYPFYTVTWPVLGPIMGGYTITGDFANGFTDIRQVLPRNFQRLQSLQVRQQQLHDRGSDTILKPPAVMKKPSPGSTDGSSTSSQWSQPFAGLEQARWSRLWNIITFPTRTPSSAAWLNHLENGEVISFLVEGTIQTGPELLWALPTSRINIGLNAEISVDTYISGQFRISILREDERYARVRLTLAGESGAIASAGGSTNDIVHGFSVIGHNLLHNRTEITPFTFAIRHGKGRSLDKVFRYDLSQPQGRAAYTDAVQGRFAYSELMAGGDHWRLTKPDAAVRKIADRSAIFTRAYKGSSARYGLFYRHRHESTLTNSEITAHFIDSTARLFRSEAINSSAWRFFWGLYGQFNYSFRMEVDRDRVAKHQRDAATLVVRAEMTDSDTSGEDLYRYMDESETATGRHGFFPRPPKYRPVVDTPHYHPDDGFDRRRPDPSEGRLIEYYRSSFFYQLTFSEEQLLRFISLPDDRRWPMLEQAFRVTPGAWGNPALRATWDVMHLPERVLNIPLYAIDIHYAQGSMLEHARAMIESWRKAASTTNLDQRVAALGEMFADRRYSSTLVRLLRLVLSGERVSYVIQGSSHAFGYLRDEGIGTTPIDPLPAQKELTIDFDRVAARAQDDPLANIDELSVEPLGDGRFRIVFKTGEQTTPKDLYISLLEIRPWHLPHEIGQAAYVDSQGMLAPGRNVLVLSAEDGPFAQLLSEIEPGNAYVLKVAYSRDGHNWGPIAETRFSVPPPRPAP